MVSLIFLSFSAFHASQINVLQFIFLVVLPVFVSYQVRQIQHRCNPDTVLPTTVINTQVNWTVNSKHSYLDYGFF